MLKYMYAYIYIYIYVHVYIAQCALMKVKYTVLSAENDEIK